MQDKFKELREYYFDMFPDFDTVDTPIFTATFRADFDMLQELEDVFEQIEESRDLENAFGYTLDLIALNRDLKRPPGMPDDEFRELIKIQIMANKSSADIETLNTIARFMFGEDFLSLEETWKKEEIEDLAGIQLRLRYNAKSDPRLINRAKAGGVKMFYELTNEANIQVHSRHLNPVFVYPLTNELVTSTRTHASVYDVGDVSTWEKLGRMSWDRIKLNTWERIERSGS